MSDPTKKSIVINKSFLSGSDNSKSSNIQKKSKKNTRNLSEEIIKPNKLKKMLLDKINAKRKADQTSSPSLIGGSDSGSGNGIKNVDTLDISKETRLFSSEFKKSLDFLDSYIGQKRNDKNKNKNNTLKKQNTSTSLNNDILKSLHNNSNNQNHNHNHIHNNVTNSHALSPANNIHQSIQTQAYIAQPIQPTQMTQIAHHPAPFFQKIQLDSEDATGVDVSVSPKLLQMYQEARNDYDRRLDQFCRGRGITLVPTTTDAPFEALVLDVLRARGLVQ